VIKNHISNKMSDKKLKKSTKPGWWLRWWSPIVICGCCGDRMVSITKPCDENHPIKGMIFTMIVAERFKRDPPCPFMTWISAYDESNKHANIHAWIKADTPEEAWKIVNEHFKVCEVMDHVRKDKFKGTKRFPLK
jgi:hypothetical protein